MNLMAWVRRILRPPSRESPPPLAELNIPSREDRRNLLEETHSSIRHRERILRTLEARANVRGGAFHGGDEDNDHD